MNTATLHVRPDASAFIVPLLALLCGCGPDQAADTAAPLSPGFHPIDARETDGNLTDLAPLGDLIDGVEVVGLGEPIHTSGGFYRAKHKAIRALVEEHGYRAVAFENPWTNTDELGAFVRDGVGDPVELMSSEFFFATWSSEEVLALVQWLRSWNVEHPDDPVELFGFDIQQPWYDAPALRSLIDELGPSGSEAMLSGIDSCAGSNDETPSAYYSGDEYGNVSADSYANCLAGLAEVESWLIAEAASVEAAIGAEALELARLRVLGLRAWEGQQRYQGTDYDYELRDEGMAEIFLRLRALRYPGVKTVIWAHNWHIARHTEDMVQSSREAANMGGLLDDALGAAYAPFALTAYELSYHWDTWAPVTMAPPTSEYAIELFLHEQGTDLLVDLDSFAAYFGADTVWRLGCSEPNGGADLLLPAQHYRGLIYLEVSEEMTWL